MKVLGIDCGLDGYAAMLDGESQSFWATPTIKDKKKRRYDVAAMRRILVDSAPDLVVVEKQQAMPGQGVSSTFSTGYGYGLWLGLLAGLGIRHLCVHPRTWQKEMHRDVPGTDTKARSVIACGRMFPTVDLRASDRCRKPHDGKADALLIAAYGLKEQDNGE